MKKLEIPRSARDSRLLAREILRSKGSRYTRRLMGVQAVSGGLSCYEAASALGASPRSVEHWVRRFCQEGPVGLHERKRPGRPGKLRDYEREILAKDLERKPADAGYRTGRWTGELVRHHLTAEYGVRLGLRQCQRLLRGFSMPKEAINERR